MYLNARVAFFLNVFECKSGGFSEYMNVFELLLNCCLSGLLKYEYRCVIIDRY